MRIVIKVGTSTLAHSTGRLNIRHAEELVKVLSDLKNEGHEVILVSSGAIGMGVGKRFGDARTDAGDFGKRQQAVGTGKWSQIATRHELHGDEGESAVFARIEDRHDVRVMQAASRLGLAEEARARAVWRQRFGTPAATPQERARQMRFLAARGFSGDTVRRVLRGAPDGDGQ